MDLSSVFDPPEVSTADAPTGEDMPEGYGVDENSPLEEVTCFHPDADVDDQDRRDLVAEEIFQRFNRIATGSQRTEAERSWRAAERMYYGYKETNSTTEVVIREVWRQVRIWCTQIAKGLTAGDVLFKAEARIEGFDEDADGATAVIHDQLKRSGSRQQLDAFIKLLAVYGNAYIVPGYRKFKRNLNKMTSVHADGDATWWDKETSEVYENLPYLEAISPWDCYQDPSIEESQNSPFFIYKQITGDGLKTQIREGYIDADATRDAFENSDGGSTEYRTARGDTLWDGSLDFLDGDNRLHQILVYWDAGWEYVVLDQQYLLRAMPLPDGETPIISARFDPMTDKHYSLGIPCSIGDEQRVVNQIVSYKLGNMGYDCNPVILAKRGTDARKNWKNGVISPGACVEVDSPTDLTYLQRTSPQGTMNNEIAFWQDHQKEQIGLNDRVSGNGSNSGTATGASQLSSAATEPLENQIRMLTPAFELMYRWMYNLNARHNNSEYVMRITGVNGANVFKRYTPEVFKPDVDVNVEVGGGASAEKAMTAANNFKLLYTVPGFDAMALGDEVLKNTPGIKGVKKYHTSSNNSQGDALGENQQWQQTGILAEPRPGDNHMMHIQIHQYEMQGPNFAAMPPWFQQTMAGHMAIHQQFAQQQQAANAQMQQQAPAQMGGGQGPMGGATPVQNAANATANANFQMGARGAAQQGAA